MNWFILTLLSVLFVSIASILQKVLMKEEQSNPYSYAVVFQFLIAILNIPIIFIFGFEPVTLNVNLFFFLIAAALWAGAIVFYFKALKSLEASEVTILSSIRIVITIFASILLLQETFNILQVLGAALILFSTFLVTNLKKGLRFNKGVIYTFITALFSSLAIVADGYNVRNYDVVSYSVIVSMLIVIVLLVFNPKVMKDWKNFTRTGFLKKMLPLGVFSTIQGVAYLLALASGGDVSQVGTIRQASVILTVILAVVFLNEKDNLVSKLLASILVTIGVILLS